MCFLEFIGYTCGHTSLPVLRPCPLTTASHTFPTCTRRADKPFLAGEMCSACQKIIHSRATQIEEYEHRFMHERGVCGCDTVFPYLIRPRFIGGGCSAGLAAAGVDDDGTATALPLLLDETDAEGCAVVSVRLSSLFAAEWVADHRARHEAGLCRCRVDFRTYQQAVAELEEEAEKAFAGDGGGGGDEKTGPPSVANAGPTEERGACAMDECGIWASHPLFARADARRTVSSSPPRWRRQYGGGGDSGDRTTGRREDSTDGYTASRRCTRSHDRGGSASPRSSPNGQEELQQDRQAAVWLARDVNGINVDGGSGDGNGVRFAGAVFAEVPAYLPITGPFLVQPSPYGAPGGQWPLMDGISQRKPAEAEPWGAAEAGGPSSPALLLCSAAAVAVTVTAESSVGADADGATTSSSSSSSRAPSGLPGHQPMQACTRDPLVGLPIGAGPEGASHALPWESRPRCWWRV